MKAHIFVVVAHDSEDGLKCTRFAFIACMQTSDSIHVTSFHSGEFGLRGGQVSYGSSRHGKEFVNVWRRIHADAAQGTSSLFPSRSTTNAFCSSKWISLMSSWIFFLVRKRMRNPAEIRPRSPSPLFSALLEDSFAALPFQAIKNASYSLSTLYQD